MKSVLSFIRDVIGVLIAALLFGVAFGVFLVMARDADEGHIEYTAEVYAASAVSLPPEDPAEEGVGRFTVYVEGEGEPPEWSRPDEEMAAEWSADVTDIYVGNKPDYILDVPLDADLQAYIWTLCEEAGVPYTLVIAIIEAESTYRADVISEDGDYGLMQINLRCLSWLSDELGIVDFLDAKQNALAGVWILGGYYRQYGYASGALVAYNQGQQSAEAMFSAGIYETDYSRRVMEIQRRLEAEGR